MGKTCDIPKSGKRLPRRKRMSDEPKTWLDYLEELKAWAERNPEAAALRGPITEPPPPPPPPPGG